MTASTRQVALGDAIVCWRTCVVWQGNRAVRLTCGLFLLATVGKFPESYCFYANISLSDAYDAVLGQVDTPLGCRSAFIPSQITYFGTAIGSTFEGLSVGLAACVLSLSTNLLATLLVGYKAWYVTNPSGLSLGLGEPEVSPGSRGDASEDTL